MSNYLEALKTEKSRLLSTLDQPNQDKLQHLDALITIEEADTTPGNTPEDPPAGGERPQKPPPVG